MYNNKINIRESIVQSDCEMSRLTACFDITETNKYTFFAALHSVCSINMFQSVCENIHSVFRIKLRTSCHFWRHLESLLADNQN